MEVKVGQKWKNLKSDSTDKPNAGHIYSIEYVHRDGKYVAIWDETGGYKASSNYATDHFARPEKWEFVSDGPESECPDCGQVKAKASDDFICVDCRKEKGAEARLIAEHDSDLTIVNFRSSPQYIAFLKDDREFLKFSRSDLPEPVIKAIRDFIGS